MSSEGTPHRHREQGPGGGTGWRSTGEAGGTAVSPRSTKGQCPAVPRRGGELGAIYTTWWQAEVGGHALMNPWAPTHHAAACRRVDRMAWRLWRKSPFFLDLSPPLAGEAGAIDTGGLGPLCLPGEGLRAQKFGAAGPGCWLGSDWTGGEARTASVQPGRGCGRHQEYERACWWHHGLSETLAFWWDCAWRGSPEEAAGRPQ